MYSTKLKGVMWLAERSDSILTLSRWSRPSKGSYLVSGSHSDYFCLTFSPSLSNDELEDSSIGLGATRFAGFFLMMVDFD